MQRWQLPIILFIIIMLLLFSRVGHCEYNLATGQEEMILISPEREVSIGQSLSQQVEKKIKPDENYTNQERIDIIGQKLAAVSDRRDIVYHFKVLADDKNNAFSLPGGYVYIFRGLVERLETDDEVAAILAHEIAHICAKHSVKRLQNSLGYELMRFLIIRGAEDAYSRYKANEAINQLLLAYSREDESEADRLTVKYVKKAGYNPEAVVRVLDKLIEWQMKAPLTPKMYWHTHPYLSARRASVNEAVTGQMQFDDYINVTPDEGYVGPRY